jgi:hypothetical protein
MPGKIPTSQRRMVWITLAVEIRTSGQVSNTFLICLRDHLLQYCKIPSFRVLTENKKQ